MTTTTRKEQALDAIEARCRRQVRERTDTVFELVMMFSNHLNDDGDVGDLATLATVLVENTGHMKDLIDQWSAGYDRFHEGEEGQP